MSDAQPDVLITVDRNACVGTTDCIRSLPQVFTLDDDGISTVHDPLGASRDAIVDAAENCPVRAIEVVDAATRAPLV